MNISRFMTGLIGLISVAGIIGATIAGHPGAALLFSMLGIMALFFVDADA